MSATLVETGLFLSPELAGTLMTPEEFDAAEECEEGYNYELINGVLVVSPPPLEGERGPNDYLGYLLRSYQEHHALVITQMFCNPYARCVAIRDEEPLRSSRVISIGGRWPAGCIRVRQHPGNVGRN